MQTIRLEDVARAAGVSMKTVSRVVNDEPNVRPVMKQKVMKAVKALNYRPNVFARSLAGSRSYLVGLLYRDVTPAYLLAVQNGALAAGRAAHYGLVPYPCETIESRLPHDVADFLDQSRVDGVILTPPLSDDHALLLRLDAGHIPYVRLSPRAEAQTPDNRKRTVSIDEKQAGAAMMQHLLDLGHRRIGFIRGPENHGASRWRYDSYREALESAGFTLDPMLVAAGDFSFDSGKRAGAKLLATAKPPTAIFASNDDMAAGVIHAAHEKGLHLPTELSVAGFDDSPLARQIWPALTTIHQPMRHMGQTAMQQLLGLIRKVPAAEENMSGQVLLDHALIIRDSTTTAKR